MSVERRSPWPLGPLLAALLLTLAVYARALSGELVYDDLQMIARNPGLGSLSGIPRLFTQGYWDFLGESAGYNGYWRPLTATVLAVANVVGGGRTWVFHAACILVHLGATWLAYALALRLARSRVAAFFTALLFGLHPVHVESVAWITALNDPLFGLLGMASLLAFLRWRERGSRGVPVVAAACFAAALLAKELALSIVPMLVALDWLRPRSPAERSSGVEPAPRFARPARAYVPFAAVLVAYFLARVAVFGEWTGGLERVTTYFGVGEVRLALLRVELLGGALKLLAWPVGLNVFRPFHPSIALTHPAVVGAAVALGVWGALLAFALKQDRRVEALALVIAALGVLPALIRVESLGRFPLSDRFLYVSVLGFALWASALAPRLLPGNAARIALGLVAALFAFGSWQRIAVWHDEEALFRSAVRADERSPYALWGLGRVLLEQYRATGDKAALAEAFDVYERAQELAGEAALERDDTDVFLSGGDVLQINLGYGWCLLYEAEFDDYHDFDTPKAVFEQLLERIYAVRADADKARRAGYQVVGEHLEAEFVHVALGVAHTRTGDLDEAEASYRAALAENPDYAEARYNYGKLLMLRGDPERARRQFEEAMRLRPGVARDKLAFAQALLESGWPDRAEPIARELHELDEDDPEAMMVLAMCAEARGDWSGALRWTDLVLEVEPNHPTAWHRRALALVKRGESSAAIDAFRRAVELAPDDFNARYNFASTLLSNGAMSSAVPHVIAAYRLCRDGSTYLKLRETLRSLPVGPEQAAELAAIDRSRGQLDSALEWIERSLSLDATSGQALLTQGRILQDLGRNAGAMEALEAACAALPGAYVPRFELGAFYARLGRVPEALERLREARDLGPPTSWKEPERVGARKSLDDMIRQLEETGELIGPSPVSPPAGG